MTPAPSTQGLSSREAETRLAQFGPNDPAPSRRRSGIVQLLILFLNPLVVILPVAAAASAFLGERVDAAIIGVVVVVGVAINFVQTYRSSQAAERLPEQVTPTATVVRDGTWQEIPRRVVVPGDLIRLSAGDPVPADAARPPSAISPSVSTRGLPRLSSNGGFAIRERPSSLASTRR